MGHQEIPKEQSPLVSGTAEPSTTDYLHYLESQAVEGSSPQLELPSVDLDTWNRQTEEQARKANLVPKTLVIEPDGRVLLDGEPYALTPLRVDLWRELLEGYMKPLFLPTGRIESSKERSHDPKHVRRELLELEVRGILWRTKDGRVTLKPLFIKLKA